MAVGLTYLVGILFSADALLATPRMSVAEFFNRANYDNLSALCDEFYAEEVKFIDPLGTIEGRAKLVGYYQNLYENVISIRFDTVNRFEREDGKEVFEWQMHVQHKRVGGGDPIIVDGVSVLHFGEDGKVFYHRDYFDLGTMLYEKIPVLGSLLRWIKGVAHGG